ncbi:hypothetical protein L0B53_05980 [Vibrio sp. SS-MA-C1-2]|uniref:hypothetical protein n=1 Tax=Vibrio sp. SS-MA-C1-2 TaxID=2908646 RepID=UPI001F2E7656|nr:hypothetical protein [Vibrio sp. SS-MA-C1-2]UJF19125.1 hypothetical protein L0B53_05980 [Vibrio sp. SS-MA-C1-2]
MSSDICFNTSVLPIFDPTFWESIATGMTIAGVIITAIAVGVAYDQLKKSQNQSAMTIYQSYLELCVQHPKFAEGMKKPPYKTSDYKQYRWFVNTTLYSFEQVYLIKKSDPQWLKTLENQLQYHKVAIKSSSSLKEDQWDKKFKEFIKKSIN